MPGPRESTPSSPDGPAPTFLELYLKDVRDVGGFGRVLGLCVQAWRRLVLTKHRKTGAAQGQAVPRQALDTPRPSPAPGGLLALAAGWPRPAPRASQPPARSQPCFAGGLGNKGRKKSDNFSPQLDLIFFFDAPTAGGRIAGEEQVRQENATLGARGGGSARGLPGRRRARSRRLPGSGFIPR